MDKSLDKAGRSELHYAAADGDCEKVAKLIRDGELVNLADLKGWTPLHFAAQASSKETIELLLKAGAEIDSKDSDGNTPLSRAVFNSRGGGNSINLLRELGASPYAKNNYGVSPLSLARTIGNYDVAQFFNDLPPETE